MWISITSYCCWLNFNVDQSQKLNFINVKETVFFLLQFLNLWLHNFLVDIADVFSFICFWNDIFKNKKKKLQKCLKTTLPDKKYDHYCTNKQKQHSKTHWDCYKAWWTIWKKPTTNMEEYEFFFKFFNAVLLSYDYLITQKCVFVSINMWVSVISIYLIHEEANVLHVIDNHELRV